MKKTIYLDDPAVRKFAAWLGANLDNGTLAHGWLDRRTGAAWRCTSAFDAFRQYAWAFPTLPTHHIVGGSSFAASATALGVLKAALSGAVSDQQARHAATGVVLWGGVGAGNVRWLGANVAGLLATLQATAKALVANDLKNPLLTARGLRFNAGMTKVYSLVVPGMIIYDSRVAAALAWAVTRYCVASGLTTVPAELAFPVAPAKQAPGMVNPKCRDPSSGRLKFPALVPGPSHAAWNLKASWVLEEALRIAGTGSQFNHATASGGDALRALEAALFMIGYDLPGMGGSGAPAPGAPRSRVASAAAPAKTPGVTCYTLARKTPFDYRLSAGSLQIDGQPACTTQMLQRLVDALSKSFGASSFPLGNARDRVASGQAAAGFGTAFTATTGRSSQAASRLAAALVDIGILYVVDESPLLLALVPATPLGARAGASPTAASVEDAFARSDEAGGDE